MEPSYPTSSVERPEGSEAKRDWRLLFLNLLKVGVIGGFIVFLLFILALLITFGGILRLF